VSATTQPYLLVRGGAEGTVVDDADVAELMRRRPDAKVVTVSDAGHSIQGDQPLALAELIAGQLG
jgi:pimeloyl-ACP methyl ester carboxylesterase